MVVERVVLRDVLNVVVVLKVVVVLRDVDCEVFTT